jgi:HK97 gp10 family phage protein
MMADLVHVSGLAELSAALRELPGRIGRNVLRGAVAAGAAEIRKAAMTTAPVYTGEVSKGHPPPGTLRRALYQKQIRELSNDQAQVFFVGVRQGKKYRNQGKKKNLSQDAYYWRFVEFGTSKMAARPFLRPAFEQAKMVAVERLRDYMAARIAREVAQLSGANK